MALKKGIKLKSSFLHPKKETMINKSPPMEKEKRCEKGEFLFLRIYLPN